MFEIIEIISPNHPVRVIDDEGNKHEIAISEEAYNGVIINHNNIQAHNHMQNILKEHQPQLNIQSITENLDSVEKEKLAQAASNLDIPTINYFIGVMVGRAQTEPSTENHQETPNSSTDNKVDNQKPTDEEPPNEFSNNEGNNGEPDNSEKPDDTENGKHQFESHNETDEATHETNNDADNQSNIDDQTETSVITNENPLDSGVITYPTPNEQDQGFADEEETHNPPEENQSLEELNKDEPPTPKDEPQAPKGEGVNPKVNEHINKLKEKVNEHKQIEKPTKVSQKKVKVEPNPDKPKPTTILSRAYQPDQNTHHDIDDIINQFVNTSDLTVFAPQGQVDDTTNN